MASVTSCLCPHVISFEEYESLPEEIRSKVEDFVKNQVEECVVAKALYESSKVNNEQLVNTLQNDISKKSLHCENTKIKLDAAVREFEEAQIKLQELNNEVVALKDSVSRLETENSAYRHQRDLAVDEKNELLKAVERRNAELERFQEDYRLLSSQLQAAVTAKCEALVKSDEVETQRLNLEFREKRMEQERERMNKEIENLTAELNKRTEELMNSHRDGTTRRITLETQLGEKIEELKIAQQTIEGLEASNMGLNEKLEDSLRKLKGRHETEQDLQKSFEDELQRQAKLSDLYKEANENSKAKEEKLQSGINELRQLLKESVERLEKAEENKQLMLDEYEKKLEERSVCIEELKLELQSANELVEGIRQEKLDNAIEELSPSAASVSRLINSGMTLTQVYMKWAEASQDLMIQKDENRRLNEYMNNIVKEIEGKAPELRVLRDEHANIVQNMEQVCRTLDNSSQENHDLRVQMKDLSKAKEHFERENVRLKSEMTDLSRQVCFLLQEAENVRCNGSVAPEDSGLSAMEVTSSQVISKHLVTFNSVQELQTNNQKLLALVRELSKKAEEEEMEGKEGYSELKAVVKAQETELADIKEREKRQLKMMERAMRQLNLYKEMVLRSRATVQDISFADESDCDMPETEESAAGSPPKSTLAQNDTHAKQIKELTEKLQSTERAMKELQEETDAYRIERQTNERMLTEQIETMRSELRELRMSSSKVVSQLEYSEERFKIMQGNCNTYKTQIAALEGKNKTYSNTIVKHEQSIVHLQDELLCEQKKLARAEVCLENARRECTLLRDTEARLQRECEAQRREQHGQAMLLANLDTIRASLERTEAEGRARLETRLDESLRECAALRRRLQEEQDRFRELSKDLERQAETAKIRLEEEREIVARGKTEIDSIKEELHKTKNELLTLHKRMKDSMDTSVTLEKQQEAEALEKRVRDLEIQLKNEQSELAKMQELLDMEKKHSKQFCDVSESLEARLSESLEESTRYREASEKRLTEVMNTEEELRRKVAALESQLSSLQTGSNQSSAQLNRSHEELQALQKELDQAKHNLTDVRMEVASLSSALQAAEEKYAHEVVLHSNDIQSLMNVKKELTDVAAEVSKLQEARVKAEQALELGKEGWQEREIMLQTELNETQERIKDLDAQNAVLHDQIEALGAKISILQAQGYQPSPNTSLSEDTGNKSLNSSFTEGEVKSVEQLMQIIKYLRHEKNIVVGRCDLLRAENQRVKSQLDSLRNQLEEARKSLSAEKESSDVSIFTAAKHTEVLRKLETVSAITDSNRILRGERDALQAQVKELQQRVETLETELGPLREQNRDLTAKLDSLEAENTALRGEAGRLRQRVNFLIERSSKTSPEDWRRLQQERETLARQVTTDREALQRKDEEARSLRQDKARLEEQLQTLSRQQQQQADEVRRQGEELNTLQQRLNRLTQELNEARVQAKKKNEELAKITEDLGAKEALLTDARTKEFQIRKIAKKYKTQSEELTRSREEEAQKVEGLEKALAEAQTAAQSVEIPAETKEQLRDEGRRELEARLQETEARHSDRVKELDEQITRSQEEIDNLHKEIESLKNIAADKEVRAKNVLKNARSKLTLLTETNKSCMQRVEELEGRLQSAEQGKDEDSVRMSALKSQYENRIGRLEKEISDLRTEKQHEAEAFNQRIIQLQRQLEKYQSVKPSTSSGSGEKTVNEPPTANIKPMAGPSSTGLKQSQSQQSAAVTPWVGRGDTPFASIRPMSMQSRTAAVLPTSQTASSSLSPGTPVLVPPQQQLVHTTGSAAGSSSSSSSGGGGGPEGLSSSPTSSHTDYIAMAATSSASSGSAGVRQVAVPPTVTTVTPSTRDEPPQSAQSVAESTQDIEAEPAVAQAAVPAGSLQQLQPGPGPGAQQRPLEVGKGEAQAQGLAQTQQPAQAALLPGQQPAASPQPPQPVQAATGPALGSQQLAAAVPAPSAPQQGQAVAMVLPRVEQQSAAAQPPQQVEQAAAAPSSQASSSNTVTTSQAGVGSKRARDTEGEVGDEDGKAPQGKRSRVAGSSLQDVFPASSDSALEVEYQVPTSSQRDQEDDVNVSDEDEEGIADEGVMEEPDDGHEFDDDVDNAEGYAVEGYRDEPKPEVEIPTSSCSLPVPTRPHSRNKRKWCSPLSCWESIRRKRKNPRIIRKGPQELTSFEEVEGPDIDEENAPDQDNNEAEIMADDSSEVPNQSGRGSPSQGGLGETVRHPEAAPQQHPEASSSGPTEVGSGGPGAVGTSQVASSVLGFGRGPTRSVPPLMRQQQASQLLMGYEEAGDDSIVPSTPTLFVPRRSDCFGEAVSSPQVPQARFTFSDTNPPAARVGVAQAASEGMDDTRMDLSQLEEAGTGRSVPTTPLQVSPQEMSSEVGQSEAGPEDTLPQGEIHPEASGSQTSVPSITVTEASEDDTVEIVDDMPPPELAEYDEPSEQRDSAGEPGSEQEDVLELADEGGDGVSSEGEKSQPMEEVEEGREAEATETAESQEVPRRVTRAANTARRSARNHFRGQRGRGSNIRPTPIVWNEPGSSMGSQGPRGRACMMQPMRGSPGDQMRGNYPRGNPRSRRPRGKPKGNFNNPYQMRF